MNQIYYISPSKVLRSNSFKSFKNQKCCIAILSK